MSAGPWELRVNGVFLRVIHGKHKSTVADGIISEANARLIAAAPDLLEAAAKARIKLARYREQHGDTMIGGVAAEYDAVVHVIDAAIKAATA